ncbi:chlorophyll synthesis pathway protein BchC [Wenzhouxiangella sp. XN79A]|uniref:chlorophyll synthesis pathway protein BchC n=1 Tax=Wenzhouxiangella sp. XN79A TaxID=2724193 RepID=UPI00144AA14C|nr:chlorophyll synthesis pathway protein BchC [Wenzhouxiangella sp. XN79A]NKI34856.1 chlorophyll synthesis pathway protein BchC [Wenzhouxiangella sp. XN79A]
MHEYREAAIRHEVRHTVTALSATAVVVGAPERADLRTLALTSPGAEDVVVDIDYSGISTGTERLLWSGSMPPFPGMGYPLVPGYESIGRIISAGPQSQRQAGQFVFVPGARCYGDVRGLFGGASSRVVVPGSRTVPIEGDPGHRGVLLALAATAYHALRMPDGGLRIPELIVGHGVLGRLIARLAVALGDAPPVVWEIDPQRQRGNEGYEVTRSDHDSRSDYRVICDASGADGLLDGLIQRLAPAGEIVLAGFYTQPLQFAFPAAFMREARLRVAAEWQPEDLIEVQRLIADGRLSLDGLITDCRPADQASSAYRVAFEDPACLKMVLDWRSLH